jgi:hypothetical protein
MHVSCGKCISWHVLERRARIEMRRIDANLDLDEFDINEELQRMLDFERQRRERKVCNQIYTCMCVHSLSPTLFGRVQQSAFSTARDQVCFLCQHCRTSQPRTKASPAKSPSGLQKYPQLLVCAPVHFIHAKMYVYFRSFATSHLVVFYQEEGASWTIQNLGISWMLSVPCKQENLRGVNFYTQPSQVL